MELSLQKAAKEGDTNQLHSLLEEDPLLLRRFALSHYPDSPLHIAVLARQANFVKEILHHMPSFAWDRNKSGVTALHIAAAIGSVDLVREIFKASSPSLCLLKEKGGLTPLHYAAMKGRVEVIEELLNECPEAIRSVTADGETALHLAVVNSQFEALGVLVDHITLEDHEVLYAVDCLGNNIFQLAQRLNQLEVMNLLRIQGLMTQDPITTRTENYVRQEHKTEGISHSIDVLELRREINYDHITSASPPAQRPDQKQEEEDESPFQKINEIDSSGKVIGGIPEGIIQVLASLVAGVTYSAVSSPPQTVWKDNMKLDMNCLLQHLNKEPSFSLSESTKECPAVAFYGFMGFNTAGFICAVYLIVSRTLKIPGAVEFLFPTSMILLVISYLCLLISMTPDFGSFFIICSLAIFFILYTFCPFAISRFFTWLKEQRETARVYEWSDEKPPLGSQIS